MKVAQIRWLFKIQTPDDGAQPSSWRRVPDNMLFNDRKEGGGKVERERG
ncbi:hypothetical protein Ptr902_09631 [Pyrenophora tritici-repentis]|nr:hypothetical protein Ptr902_09631 [Pyrenophora tritici-repentis]